MTNHGADDQAHSGHDVYFPRGPNALRFRDRVGDIGRSGLELLGSGMGSASLPQIVQALAEFFQAAAQQPFHFQVKTAPLKEIEKFWNIPEQGARLVFQP